MNLWSICLDAKEAYDDGDLEHGMLQIEKIKNNSESKTGQQRKHFTDSSADCLKIKKRPLWIPSASGFYAVTLDLCRSNSILVCKQSWRNADQVCNMR